MKYLTLTLIGLLLLSCNTSGDQRLISNSSGNINVLSVVVDNLLWEEQVGETIREVLAAPIYGLPQPEPTFSLRQMPPQIFTDFATRNRTVFKVEKGKDSDLKILKNVYAKPQTVVLVTGNTNSEIIDQINQNKERIISAFKTEEIKERQRRTKISPHKTPNIQNALNLNITFPSAYRIAQEDNGFFWLRRDIKTGTINLLLYELPLDSTIVDESSINEIIKIRDSIGKKYVPGPVEGTFMITEEAYTPFVSKTIIDNKPTLVTRSTWEVKNAFMAGPFINYIIEDKQNNRFVVAEGFTYAPSVDKRDYMFELESIIRSIQIN